MKKRVVSLLLCVMLLVSAMPAAAAAADSKAGFTDITDSETAEAANALRSMDVISGTTDTTFSPENPLTRAHVCKMIISAMGLQNQVASYARKTLFSDVSPTSVFAGYINLAYDRGIFQGYGDGTFGPGNPITYGQLASVLLRMLGYTSGDVGSVWPTDDTAFCESLELNGSLELTPYQTLNRGQAAILIYNALKADTASGKAYYTTIGTVASTQMVTVLDTDARQNNITGLLRCYTVSGSSVSVKHFRQANPVPAAFAGYSGILLLNNAGRTVGFLPDDYDSSEGILQDTESDSITISGETLDTASNAVVIVGESVYSWSSTGYLQGSRYVGKTIRVFRDDIGDVTCVYIPVDDEAQARKLAVASTQTGTILDTDAADGDEQHLLMAYLPSGSTGTVKYFEQADALSADAMGKSGDILLNSDGDVVGFRPDTTGKQLTLLAADEDEISDGSTVYEPADNAVVIVGEKVYSWSGSGYLQANRHLGKSVRLFTENGDVTCLFIPVEDSDAEAKLAVTSTQNVILVSADTVRGTSADELTACVISGNAASISYYDRKADFTGYEGQLGKLLLNRDGDAVGFIPSTRESRDITVASAKLSGIVDSSGASHRIPGSATLIAGDTVYVWKDSGYLRLSSNSGKMARLYYDDDGSVSCVQLLSGGTASDTGAILAETVTAAGELVRRLGISGAYSITKNGMAASADDLARYDIAYFDEATRTLRASDYQFTGYLEAASPNVAEAETITVGGHEFTVLDAAWASLDSYTLGSRVTLLLTDDLKVAMATSDSNIAADILGVLDSTGKSVTLLGSGLTMTADTVSAQENLYGTIVRVTVSRDQLNCYRYTSSGSVSLNIPAGTLGSYPLAPNCAIFEHTSSGSYGSHVYSLSGEKGKASYNFDDLLWTDTLPAVSIGAWHLNSAGKVDMLLLKDVTGNCYEYGEATRYTGTDGVNVGTRELAAYNDAVTVTNAAGESAKRICQLYDARTGAWLGVSYGNYNANSHRVISLKVLTEITDVDTRQFFLSDDRWYVTADASEIPVSDAVQVYVEATDQWLSGETGLKTAMDMAQDMTVYYDRSVTNGAQIRVIVVHK